MKRLTRLILLTWMALTFGGHIAMAQSATVRDIADQTVLVHRITKSVCLILAGAETPVHAEDVEKSATNLSKYKVFKPRRPDETDTLARDVSTLTQSARQIAAGDRHSVPVTLLLRTNPHLAQRYARLQRHAPAAVTDLHRRSYVRVHMLRVTSQAFQRDLCLFLTDLAPDGAQADLWQNLVFFETSLDQLISGDAEAGLVPAPTIQIKVTLGKVQSKWKTLKPILSAAAAGQPVDPREAQLASVLGDAILGNLDDISAQLLSL